MMTLSLSRKDDSMTTTLTITGRDIHTDQGDANTFKGFGYLNCNNSSRLLLDLQMAAA
ncbi:hypothetical protein FC91_GL002311 [Schleiferilactobacillus harbinensis DSM 16991]|jgi:hypothetical protein|uniref:Uncharacterized protein n=1 Tax=Schleiferilactobacillus harbinensis DSM 16991 TaxID=1122147 RepID=A0A0R1XCM6_9LACO|nr:hypothetical protein FC91_GL002311 [Schleiferilactobacillus harbinensis DSM 16991]